jgi:hypothetical protein
MVSSCMRSGGLAARALAVGLPRVSRGPVGSHNLLNCVRNRCCAAHMVYVCVRAGPMRADTR